MKKYLDNLKWGIIFWIWILMVLSVSVFAYQFTNYADIWDVSSWETLSKNTFNQLLADVRYLRNNWGESTSWPIFRAKITTTQTFGTTYAIIDWDNIDIDTNNNFDLVNNRFLPTKAGKYFISCHVQWSNLWSALLNWAIYKNWVIYSSSLDRYSWSAAAVLVNSIIEMNWTTDYVDCRTSEPGDSSWTLNPAWTTFEWHYIWN